MKKTNIQIDISDKTVPQTPNIRSVQSANALFNFMKKLEYLKKILERKAIVPRYNLENVSYLNTDYNSIMLPMVCFCDINLHKVLPHTNIYGEFGIAFSKMWGIKMGIQPIHYFNTNSNLIHDFNEAYNAAKVINDNNNLVDTLSSYLLSHLMYMKPLTGFQEINKNFHDEREWRYIPKFNEIETGLHLLYTNTKLQNEKTRQLLNESIIKVRDVWLNYEFSDIKYLIVPSEKYREKLINHIDLLKTTQDNKYKLISKILILKEIKEDA